MLYLIGVLGTRRRSERGVFLLHRLEISARIWTPGGHGTAAVFCLIGAFFFSQCWWGAVWGCRWKGQSAPHQCCSCGCRLARLAVMRPYQCCCCSGFWSVFGWWVLVGNLYSWPQGIPQPELLWGLCCQAWGLEHFCFTSWTCTSQ